MRPDAINWANKKDHISLQFVPRQSVPHRLWRWIGLAIVLQALTTMIVLALLQGHRWHAEQVDGSLPHGSAWKVDHVTDAMNDSIVQRFMLDGVMAIGVGLFVAGLGVLPLARYRVRRWSHGLHALHMAIHRLAQGAQPQPLAVGGSDDIAYLSLAFNDMANQISVSHRALLDANRDLEQRVEQRTEQWRHASERAEAANHAKSAFLATMSHEIRTPLHGVLGSLTLLADTSLTVQQSRLIDSGKLSASALLNLINDILDYSSIEAGQLELNEQSLTIQELVEEAITIVGPLANQKAINVTSRVESAVSGRYQGDRARLRQIVINLINNAIKFTDTGYVDVHVLPDPANSAALRIEICDTGIGIAEDQVDRLFARFSQVYSDACPSRGGTGLGLAISKYLVQRMGGEIGVESTVGEGSKFWFTVPLAQLDKPDTTPATPGRGKRILLIETCPSIQRMVRHYLEPLGHTVTTAAHYDGHNVVPSATSPFDIVIIGRDDAHATTVSETIVQNITSQYAGHMPSPQIVLIMNTQEHVNLVTRVPGINEAIVLDRPLKGTELCQAFSEAKPSVTHSISEDRRDPSVRPGLRVLLAEDNPINQFITVQILESLGAETDVVSNGEAAIEAVQAKCYELVLMDVLMTGMDGCTAARRIRELEAIGSLAGRLPVVALTAHAMATDHQTCIDAGMNDCLTKPIDVDRLREVIIKYTGGARDDVFESTTITPIDMVALTRLCADNPEKMTDLLKLMDERFRHFKQQLSDMTSTANYAELQQLAHTIAGSASQSAARPLSLAGRALMSANAANREQIVHQVLQEIDACLNQIRSCDAAVLINAPTSTNTT